MKPTKTIKRIRKRRFLILKKPNQTALLTTALSFISVFEGRSFDITDALAFSVGPVDLRPILGLSETFDDNVYYDKGDGRKSDFFTTFTAGTKLSIGREVTINPWLDFFEEESNFLSLNYNFNNLTFAQNSNLDALNHNLTLNGRWQMNKLSLKGTSSFKTISGLMGAGYGIKEKVDRDIYNNYYILDYKFSEKTRFYLSGYFNATDYAKNTALYDDNSFKTITGFSLKALPKTAFFGEVYYGQSAIDPNRPTFRKGPHMDIIGGFIGAQGNFTPHLSGMLKVGVESPSFSDKTPVDTTPVAEISITHRYRERTATTLAYRRYSYVSVQSAGVTYVSDSVSLNIQQKIGSTGKWIGRASTTATFDSFGSSLVYYDRNDQRYEFNVGLSYMIRVWAAANFNYSFELFESSYPNLIDYYVNRVTLSLVIGF